MGARGLALAAFVGVVVASTAGFLVVQASRPPASALPRAPEIQQFDVYLHAFSFGERGARHWVPSTLVVQEGDEVILRITNADSEASHGFQLAAFNVWVASIPPGQTATVRFRASRPGVYRFGCSLVGCAPDHGGQAGRLVVLRGSPP